jgi:hypothetical protein
MYCMRDVLELSKSTNFRGGDKTFRADCTVTSTRDLITMTQMLQSQKVIMLVRALLWYKTCSIPMTVY